MASIYDSPTPNSPARLIKITFDRKRVYELAKNLADDNRFYFQCISSSQFRQRFSNACELLSKNLFCIESIGDVFSSQMTKFDFDDNTPGNGYRSVAAVMDSCVLSSIRLLKEIKELRDTVLFRANHFCKELEAYGSVLDALRRDLETVKNFVALWTEGDLFPPEQAKPKLKSLMTIIESFDHSCFYGRAMGFQYCSSLYRVFQVIGVSLASYSLVWENGGYSDTWSGMASRLYKSGCFVLNPEERARRISDVITNADISFCKEFWGLTESPLLQELPKWFCPNLAMNEIWTIPCEESLILESLTGQKLKITPPSAHTGPRPLPLRVMSLHPREGMPQRTTTLKGVSATDGLAPKSPYILLHCHGGGFVATSSKTHEVYLRHWAKLLNCTVVSVDYSLAPENPYPRALEEILYAYAYILKHPERFGWTGERICFAGDSAGGHLLTATVLRCIQMNLKRLPDGVVLIYTPFLVEYNPSPSRLLTFLDPLLPPGILARCIAAYIGEREPPITPLNGSSPPDQRKKLTEYAANLMKGNRQTGAVSKETENGDEIISFCQISKPSPSSASSCVSNDSYGSCKGNGTPKFFGSIEEESTSGDEEDESGGEAKVPKSKSTELSKRKSIDSYEKSSPSEKPKFFVTRQRSQSDPSNESSTTLDDIDESCTDSGNNLEVPTEMTTVRIQKDPGRIFLSSSAYDQMFIDYISQHELTRNSLIRLKVPSPGAIVKKPTPNGVASPSAGPAVEGPSSAKLPRVDNRNLASHVRSYSTGSLSSVSQAIGSGLGTVTGYAMDALSVFLGSPLPNNAVDDSTSRLSAFHNLQVPKDPCLSPLYARDEVLAKMPPIALIACHLDPLLDDSIAFGKKLKKNKVPVTLDLLDSLPHGFLNFTLWSLECREGAKLCLNRIREMLKMRAEVANCA